MAKGGTKSQCFDTTTTTKSPNLHCFTSRGGIMVSFPIVDPISHHMHTHLNLFPRRDGGRVMHCCTIRVWEVRLAQMDKLMTTVHPQWSRQHAFSSAQYTEMLNGKVVTHS